jgi:mannose-6-phosphate isomerase-like protein (cupin superfamily)
MKIDVLNELDCMSTSPTRRGLRHRSLRHFRVEGGSSIGIALLERSVSPDHWEVHDDGDELLFVARGRIAIEVREPDGSCDWETIDAGQFMLVPRGAAHAVRALESSAVLFMTPLEGSRSWQAGDRSTSTVEAASS